MSKVSGSANRDGSRLAAPMQSVGYSQALEVVEGRLTRERAIELAAQATRHYAKRQRTWFRHQLERDRVHRLAPNASGWQEAVERWVNTVEENMRT